MHLNSTHIQRELAWFLDAIYKLSPEESRTGAAGETVYPKIHVFKIDDGYAVTFVRDGGDTEFTISTDKVMEMLRHKSRPLIDVALQAKYKGKPYIRRPLLMELQMALQLQAMLISPLRAGKLKCEPLLCFPWQSEHEFVCTNERDIDDARRINKMIVDGNAIASPF